MRMQTKKGQLGGIQSGFMALMFMGIAIVVTVIITAFGAEYTDNQRVAFCTGSALINYDDGNCYTCSAAFPNNNNTGNTCYNSTGSTEARTLYRPAAYNVTLNGLDSYENLSEGTGDVTDVGIITIVLGLLVALIGVFGWAGYQRMQ